MYYRVFWSKQVPKKKNLLPVLLHRIQLGKLVGMGGSELFHSCKSARSRSGRRVRGRSRVTPSHCSFCSCWMKWKMKSCFELRFCSESPLEDLLFVYVSHLFLLSLGLSFLKILIFVSTAEALISSWSWNSFLSILHLYPQ